MKNNHLLLIIAIFFVQILNAQNSVIYVNISATGNNNGTSWADAYTDLQDAINTANPNDTIWTAAGTYTPQQFPTGTTTDNRNKTFHLSKNLAIYGGFNGTETELSQRDFNTNPTILSGDLNGDDFITNTGINQIFNNISENVFHVMLTVNIDSTTIIDGFSITKGNASLVQFPLPPLYSINYLGETIYSRHGAGLYCHYSNPVISNCIFKQNNTYTYIGGGALGASIYSYFSNCHVSNCKFEMNNADEGAGIFIYKAPSISYISHCTFEDNLESAIIANSSPTDIKFCDFNNNLSVNSFISSGVSFNIENCNFNGNNSSAGSSSGAAIRAGGSIFDSTFFVIKNCTFNQNILTGFNSKGGAVFLANATVDMINCSFYQNISTGAGGAIFTDKTTLNITNCTFNQNASSGVGDAVYNYHFSTCTINNSILWNNNAQEVGNSNSTTTYNNSIIKGSGGSNNWNTILGINGGNNLDINPLFVNETIGDLNLDTTSSAINVGENNYNNTIFDIVSSPRIRDGIIDLGAYESPGLVFEFIDATICQGDSFYFADSTYTSSVINDTTLISSDSAMIFNLNYVIIDTTLITDIICNGVPYYFNGMNLNQAGNYSVTLTNFHGCDSIVHLSLAVSTPVEIVDTTITDESDTTLGSINVTLSDSLGQHYFWNTGDTTQDISNVAAGFYTLSVTDSLGCFYFFYFEVGSTVSTNFVTDIASINYFPNPVSKNEQINLEINTKTYTEIQLQLSNSIGQVISNQKQILQKGKNILQINVPEQEGIYYLNVINKNRKNHSFKIVVIP